MGVWEGYGYRRQSGRLATSARATLHIDRDKIAKDAWGWKYRNLQPKCYLVIQGIDQVNLRSRDSQACLSILARSPSVGIIASIDRIDGGLMWDDELFERFQWKSFHVPTFEPGAFATDFPLFPPKSVKSDVNISVNLDIDSKLYSFSEVHKRLILLIAERIVSQTSSSSSSSASAAAVTSDDSEKNYYSEDELFAKAKTLWIVSTKDQFNSLIKELIDQSIIVVTKRLISMTPTLAQTIVDKLNNK